MYLLFYVLLAASTETSIDALFDTGLKAEKAGDCVSAGDHYRAILHIAPKLPEPERSRVESQAKSRLERTKACRSACELSDRDIRIYEIAKEAKQSGQFKRVSELCKQLLHGKDTRCKDYAEIRAFCPEPVSDADPCTAVPPEVRSELDGLNGKVNTLVERTRQADPMDADALAALEQTLSTASDSVFQLRELYLRCDKIYAALVGHHTKLKAARVSVGAAMRAAYVERLSAATKELEALRADNADAEMKLESMARLNDEILMDLQQLVQSEALTTGTTVEGQQQRSEKEQQALTRALRGERQALESLITTKPEFFGDASTRSLAAKREQLNRIDSMLQRYEARGKGEGLGFEKARAEVRDSLALVDKAMVHAQVRQQRARPKLWPYVLGGVALVAVVVFVFVRLRRKQPASRS